MVRIACIGLALILTSLSPALAFEQADKQVGVVQVVNITRSSTGSGFVLNDEGYIATNHHVIKGGVRLYVNPDGETIDFRTLVRNPNAKVVWASSDLDLAIVKVNNPKDFQPITLAEVLPRKGETVYAVGYPGAADDYNIKGSRDLTSDALVTKGVLSRSYVGSWGRTPLELVQHNAEISWGNSGGPLFDECRRVIGINTKLTSKKFGRNVVVAPGAFFSSNVSELMKVLKNKSIAYGSTSERCQSREDQLQEMVRNSILIGIAAVVVLAGCSSWPCASRANGSYNWSSGILAL